MAYVNLYAVKYKDPSKPVFDIQPIDNYRKKESMMKNLNPKPLKLADGGYVIYIWAHTSENAELKARRIINGN